VTLPLILARRRDPMLEAAELRGLDQPAAEELCDRIADSGALDQVRGRAKQGIERAKGRLRSTGLSDEERQLLGMIADGVIERYS
jgi:geranylgeranyl pyrophosphate synthase